jgi:mannose-1-phosphate guanylyltransferase
MILAAGEGRRMAPLSERCAKPALPVLDEAMVARMVRQLAEQGVSAAVVNTHTHPETVRRALADAAIPVEISHERVLRGRGGGILGARAALEGDEPFLVLNGDMCLELDVAELVAAHRGSGAIATLALRDDPRKLRFGTIGYDARGDVVRITDRFRRASDEGSGLFTGVQVLEPRIFAAMPERENFDILADVYLPLLERGERIHAWLQPLGAGWWPVGCPGELLAVNLEWLARRAGERGVLRAADAQVEGAVEGPAWIGAGAHVARGARVGPWCVIGAGSRVPAGADFERTLLLPGARPAARSLRGAIAWDGEVWSDA